MACCVEASRLFLSDYIEFLNLRFLPIFPPANAKIIEESAGRKRQ
jgi:hypothetical protein